MAGSDEDHHNGSTARAPSEVETAESVGAASSDPQNKRRSFSGISTATKKLLGAAVTAATIIGAGATVYQVFFAGHKSSNAQYSSVTLSPVLGMQFQQNGSVAPMTTTSYGSTDIVKVSLLRQPFELLLPALQPNHAIGINVRGNNSGFDINEGSLVSKNPSFAPGTGIANYQYGNGALYVTPDAQNYFIGTRVQQASDGMQKIYIASTVSSSGTIPLTQQNNNLYLTVFRQAVLQKRFTFGSYEYFVLKFH